MRRVDTHTPLCCKKKHLVINQPRPHTNCWGNNGTILTSLFDDGDMDSSCCCMHTKMKQTGISTTVHILLYLNSPLRKADMDSSSCCTKQKSTDKNELRLFPGALTSGVKHERLRSGHPAQSRGEHARNPHRCLCVSSRCQPTQKEHTLFSGWWQHHQQRQEGRKRKTE